MGWEQRLVTCIRCGAEYVEPTEHARAQAAKIRMDFLTPEEEAMGNLIAETEAYKDFLCEMLHGRRPHDRTA